MGKQEIRLVTAALALAVVLYAAFVAVGSFKEPPPAPRPEAAPEPDDVDEYLILQVEPAAGNGWVVRVAGKEFRDLGELRRWIAAEEKGGAGLLLGSKELSGGEVVPIVQACIEGGLTKVEMRFVDDPPEREDR